MGVAFEVSESEQKSRTAGGGLHGDLAEDLARLKAEYTEQQQCCAVAAWSKDDRRPEFRSSPLSPPPTFINEPSRALQRLKLKQGSVNEHLRQFHGAVLCENTCDDDTYMM